MATIYHKTQTIAIFQNSVSIRVEKCLKTGVKMATIEEKQTQIKQLKAEIDQRKKEIIKLNKEITEEIQNNCEHKWEWMWYIDESFEYAAIRHCRECDKFATRDEYPELYINAPPNIKVKLPQW